MKAFVFGVVCAFLQVSHQSPVSHWTLLPHTLVVKVDGSMGQLSLSCLEPREERTQRDVSEDIFWRKNGEEEAQSGNKYLVKLEESLGGGNYTCHSKDGSLLNHTVVLIQEERIKNKILVITDQDYLTCAAQNYNGGFQCSWTWHSSRVGKVAFLKVRRAKHEAQCSVDTSGQRWTCSSGQSNFSCSVFGHRISCLDEQHCPYAEENQQIHITVYVRTKYFLVENYSKQFYLSEIVKPDKLRISKVNKTMIEWSYPSSWNSPFSYFPLTFQIVQFKKGCKNCDNRCKNMTVHSTDICHFEVKHGAKAVCVRAKDALCNSQWSEWSHVRLKNKNKRNRRGQNKKRA